MTKGRPLWCHVEDWFVVFVIVGLLASSLGLAYSLGELHASTHQVVAEVRR